MTKSQARLMKKSQARLMKKSQARLMKKSQARLMKKSQARLMKRSFEYVACNFCGSKSTQLIGSFISQDLADINRSLVKSKYPILSSHSKFRVVRCQNCGLAFLNPRLKEQALKIFYEGFYGKLFMGNAVDYARSAYATLNREQEIGRLKEIERYKKGGKLLDIGAGPGHFLSVAKKRGWQVYGHEYSKNAADIARKLIGQMLSTGKIAILPFPDNFFDAITMHSVLEHTSNPKEYLALALEKLKPGGLLVVSVPNLSSLNYYLAKLLRLPYPGFMFEHLYYFNPHIISQMLKDFKIVEITSYHHSRPISCCPQNEASSQKKSGRMAIFFKELTRTKKKWHYIRQRLYFFQMRLLREFFEYNKFGGKLKLGDVLYVFAQKKSARSAKN